VVLLTESQCLSLGMSVWYCKLRRGDFFVLLVDSRAAALLSLERGLCTLQELFAS